MSTNDKTAPYDPQTLYRMAEAAVARERVPDRWREDAVAEHVAAAFQAQFDSDGRNGIRAYQGGRGYGAVRNFVRRERRHEAMSPGSCMVGAKRVSMEKVIRLSDGEMVPMSETIEDKNVPQPDARLLEAERREAVERALGELDHKAREAVKLVWMEDRTQEEAALALGLSRQALQRILSRARTCLRELLADYAADFNRTRY